MSDYGTPTVSITSASSRKWISDHSLALQRYLRRNHKKVDIPDVFNLLFNVYPDEGKKLIMNDGITDDRKLDLLIKWIVHQSQLTCLALGDQRMGKDSLLCKIFELVFEYCDKHNYQRPRIVTLGNVRKPPFVDEGDMYFSFRDIPFGTSFKPVYIYSSELEAEFPARDFASAENKLFSVLEGTLAQNHQKLFGCIKLTSKVDLSVLRSCNLKLFKYISPEKLNIEGIERVNVLSDLARWFLPKDIKNKKKTLMCFDNNLLTLDFDLPSFWTDEYSEQFRGDSIPIIKIYDFIQSKFTQHEKLTASQINTIQIMVFQKFRKKVTRNEIEKCFQFDT